MRGWAGVVEDKVSLGVGKDEGLEDMKGSLTESIHCWVAPILKCSSKDPVHKASRLFSVGIAGSEPDIKVSCYGVARSRVWLLGWLENEVPLGVDGELVGVVPVPGFMDRALDLTSEQLWIILVLGGSGLDSEAEHRDIHSCLLAEMLGGHWVIHT